MPRFTSPRPVQNTKILYLGHTGAGKTGSLCSLAAAGYNVRILDLDDGVEIIHDFMLNKEKSIYLKARPGLWTQQQAETVASRISYVTCTESYKIVGTKAVSRGDSWAKLQNQLNSWKDGQDNFGSIASWDSSCVLVIDGLSRLCESAMNFQLAMNGRSATGPQVGSSAGNDYTQAYRMITDFHDLLKSTEIKCNVIEIAHIAFLESAESSAAGAATGSSANRSRDLQGFPQTVGRMISPKIGQYFNHAIQAKSVQGQRTISTIPGDHIELKTSAPLRVKPSYPLATGLAEYFRDIRASQPTEVPEDAAEEPLTEAAK